MMMPHWGCRQQPRVFRGKQAQSGGGPAPTPQSAVAQPRFCTCADVVLGTRLSLHATSFPRSGGRLCGATLRVSTGAGWALSPRSPWPTAPGRSTGWGLPVWCTGELVGTCSPKHVGGQRRVLSVLPTVSRCCQRSEAGQSSAQGRWLLLDARLSEPVSRPYLVLSAAGARLRPSCSRPAIRRPGSALTFGAGCLLVSSSCWRESCTFSTWTACLLSFPSLSALLKLALPRPLLQWLPCAPRGSSPSFRPVFMATFLARFSIA